jgi:hypothetical protein
MEPVLLSALTGSYPPVMTNSVQQTTAKTNKNFFMAFAPFESLDFLADVHPPRWSFDRHISLYRTLSLITYSRTAQNTTISEDKKETGLRPASFGVKCRS